MNSCWSLKSTRVWEQGTLTTLPAYSLYWEGRMNQMFMEYLHFINEFYIFEFWQFYILCGSSNLGRLQPRRKRWLIVPPNWAIIVDEMDLKRGGCTLKIECPHSQCFRVLVSSPSVLLRGDRIFKKCGLGRF